MRKLIYSFGVSLDGFIAGPRGEIDWSEPDEELHRFHNRQVRELDAHLLGTPYFPSLDKRIDLKLAETRTFGSRVVFLRYRSQRR